MLKRFNQLRAFDGSFEMAFVNLARQSQRGRRRHRPPITGHASQHRAFAFARPRRGQRFLKGEPKFIEKHDRGGVPPGLFLSGANPGSATPALTLRLVPPRVAGASAG